MIHNSQANIAICGLKGSGKDYAASIISHHFGNHQVAFVDPLKNVICKIYQLDGIDEYDEFKRSEHRIFGNVVHGRDIVRETGVAMRDANVNVFTDYISQQMATNKTVVISDLRFDNELKWCNDRNFIILKIVSDKASPSDGHESERSIDDSRCDIIVHNHHNETFEPILVASINKYFERNLICQ